MAGTKPKKPKMTPEEQHRLFVETARRAGAYEDPKDFDAAFRAVVAPPKPKTES